MDKINCLEIKEVLKNRNRIEYICEANGKWKELLNTNERMFVEYNFDIEEVPDSIAIIPFIGNVLPLSWVFDLKIAVNEIDKQFYECIQQFLC